MSAETAADPTTADREKSKRTRRALPITKRIARNGKVSYTLQIEAGTKPDGSRDRRRYPTQPWPRPNVNTPVYNDRGGGRAGPARQGDLGCSFDSGTTVFCDGEVAGPRSGDDAAGVRPRVRRRAGVGG
jgi:hypothetical protein